jgi:hypothetical protein
MAGDDGRHWDSIAASRGISPTRDGITEHVESGRSSVAGRPSTASLCTELSRSAAGVVTCSNPHRGWRPVTWCG